MSETATSQPHETAGGNKVFHVQLRIVERDDGYRVTEPGAQEDLTVVEETVAEAVQTYARLACGSDE